MDDIWCPAVLGDMNTQMLLNEKEGVVLCLSQAADSTGIIKTHKEAHELIPAYVLKVQQRQ